MSFPRSLQPFGSLFKLKKTWCHGTFKGMVHLISKLHLKAVFLSIKFNGVISFAQNVWLLRKVCLIFQKLSMGSQKWCLTISKSCAWQLTVQDMSTVDAQVIVRHNFRDLRNDAWRLSGKNFGIIRHHFWNLTLIFREQKNLKQDKKKC